MIKFAMIRNRIDKIPITLEIINSRELTYNVLKGRNRNQKKRLLKRMNILRQQEIADNFMKELQSLKNKTVETDRNLEDATILKSAKVASHDLRVAKAADRKQKQELDRAATL